jgi:hypothetical protein
MLLILDSLEREGRSVSRLNRNAILRMALRATSASCVPCSGSKPAEKRKYCPNFCNHKQQFLSIHFSIILPRASLFPLYEVIKAVVTNCPLQGCDVMYSSTNVFT